MKTVPRRAGRQTLCAGLVAAVLLGTVVGEVPVAHALSVKAASENSSGGEKESKPGHPLASPNFSSQLELMKSVSYQIASNGKAHKDSWVYGLRRDEEKLYSSYRQARESSRQAHFDANSTRNAPRMSGWADCGGYVATIVKNTVDPHFPWLLTNDQKSYLENSANGWTKVGDTQNYKPQDYQTGDVMITEGHIMFWVGKWQGFDDVVNDASFSRNESKLSGRMPGFRESGLKNGTSKINGKDGKVDSYNRHYEVYRFSERVANPVGVTDWAKTTAGYKFDGIPDLLAVTSAGSLRLYNGKGDGGEFNPYTTVATGFKNHQVITPGDFNKDGFQDIISVDESSGIMNLHSGTSTGKVKEPKKIGSGFRTIRDLTSVGDFDGDGNADLIGITKSDGRMLLWRGNGRGGWLPRKQIGSGFKNLKIASGGDFDGDGRPDIVSWNDSTGQVLLHRSNGKGGWLTRAVLAEKGSPYKNSLIQSVGDLDQDGYGDILVINKSTGALSLHKGSSQKKLGDSTQIGKGWQNMRSIS